MISLFFEKSTLDFSSLNKTSIIISACPSPVKYSNYFTGEGRAASGYRPRNDGID